MECQLSIQLFIFTLIAADFIFNQVLKASFNHIKVAHKH